MLRVTIRSLQDFKKSALTRSRRFVSGPDSRFRAGQDVSSAKQTLEASVCGPATLVPQAALPAVLHVGSGSNGGYLLKPFHMPSSIRRLCRRKSFPSGTGRSLPWTTSYVWSGQRGPLFFGGYGLCFYGPGSPFFPFALQES